MTAPKPIRVTVLDRQGNVLHFLECKPTPTIEEKMSAGLRTLAERTHAQLEELANEPTRDKCDLMVRALAEVSSQVRSLATELERRP